MGSTEEFPKRPLTEHELEALHGAVPDPDQIPGLPRRTPWLTLLLVFTSCLAVGFGIVYAAMHFRLL